MLRILVDVKWPVQLWFANHDSSGSVKPLENILEIVNHKEIEVHILQKGLTELDYYVEQSIEQLYSDRLDICEAEANVREIQDILSEFKALFDCIVTVDQCLIEEAMELTSFLDDFDSALELAYANSNHLDAIVTINPDNFSKTDLKLIPVNDLLDPRFIDRILEMNNNSLVLVAYQSHVIDCLENILRIEDKFIVESSTNIDSKHPNIDKISQVISTEKYNFHWEKIIKIIGFCLFGKL